MFQCLVLHPMWMSCQLVYCNHSLMFHIYACTVHTAFQRSIRKLYRYWDIILSNLMSLGSYCSFLKENPKPDKQQIEDIFDGNICRCTGEFTFVPHMSSLCGIIAGAGCRVQGGSSCPLLGNLVHTFDFLYECTIPIPEVETLTKT